MRTVQTVPPDSVRDCPLGQRPDCLFLGVSGLTIHAPGIGEHLGTVFEVEERHDLAHVILDRPWAQGEFSAGFLVGEALGDQCQHLALP